MNINKKIYIAGDIMSIGSQYELKLITDIVKEFKCNYYSPIENKSINDKAKFTEEQNNCLAEHIVQADTERLMEADIVIFNIKQHALGTLCELGQCYQMLKDTQPNKKFIFLYDDIRRETNLNEKNDRRSWSINQYVYGLVLAMSNGKGFSTLDNLKEELKNVL